MIDKDRARLYDETKFDGWFDKFDENNDRFLSKAEMAVFIKKVFNQNQLVSYKQMMKLQQQAIYEYSASQE